MKYKAFMDKTRAEQKGKSLDRNEIKAFVFKRKTKKTEVVNGKCSWIRKEEKWTKS
jgi:hypothetical protein